MGCDIGNREYLLAYIESTRLEEVISVMPIQEQNQQAVPQATPESSESRH